MKIFHGNPGFGSKMTYSKIMNFLNRKLILRLGTLDSYNQPNIHPVWFLCQNNKLYIETNRNSYKVKNIISNNIVYFCIDVDTIPYIGIRGKGIATISYNNIKNMVIATKILLKYKSCLNNKISKIIINSVKNSDSVVLEIVPKYYSTWDHNDF